MTLEKHVLKTVKDYEEGDLESALMNACFAIDGTARNLYGDTVGKKEYKDCIQKYIWIIEPMMGSGINLEETIWNNVEVDNGYGKIISNPDLADIIYHIFRCSHAHGKNVSKNYELLPPTVDGKLAWQVGGGVIRMPTLIIHALLAVSVFSKENNGIKTSGDYFLPLGKEKFIIKDWWGKEDDFKLFLSKKIPNPTRVKLEGLKNLDASLSSKGFSVQIIPPYWD